MCHGEAVRELALLPLEALLALILVNPDQRLALTL